MGTEHKANYEGYVYMYCIIGSRLVIYMKANHEANYKKASCYYREYFVIALET